MHLLIIIFENLNSISRSSRRSVKSSGARLRDEVHCGRSEGLDMEEQRIDEVGEMHMYISKSAVFERAPSARLLAGICRSVREYFFGTFSSCTLSRCPHLSIALIGLRYHIVHGGMYRSSAMPLT